MVTMPRTPGILFIGSKMVDTCVVKRDTRGIQDDILDETTGMLVRPADDYDTTVYSGKCLISSVKTGDKELRVADAQKDLNYYQCILPVDSDTGKIREGDVLTVLTSPYSEGLVGRAFRVTRMDTTTHSVYRNLLLEFVSDSIGTHNPAV
jgi:hypothetical protein